MKNRSIKVLLSFILTAAMLTGICVFPVNAEEDISDSFKAEFYKNLYVAMDEDFWYQYYTNMKDDEYVIIYSYAWASNEERFESMKATLKDLKVPSERLYECSFYKDSDSQSTQCILVASVSKEEITKLILSPFNWNIYFFEEEYGVDWFTYDASDALNILRYTVGLETKIEPSNKGNLPDYLWSDNTRRQFYDPDHDGTITANDAVYALESSVGKRKIYFTCTMMI